VRFFGQRKALKILNLKIKRIYLFLPRGANGNIPLAL
jgi:hypothetical protein